MIPTLRLKECQFSGLYHIAIARRNKKKYNNKNDKKQVHSESHASQAPAAPLLSSSSKFSISRYFSFATSHAIHPGDDSHDALKVNVLVIDDDMETNTFFIRELVDKPRHEGTESHNNSTGILPMLSGRRFSLKKEKDTKNNGLAGDMSINSAGGFGNSAKSHASGKELDTPSLYVFENPDFLRNINVRIATSCEQGLQRLKSEPFDLVFINLGLKSNAGAGASDANEKEKLDCNMSGNTSQVSVKNVTSDSNIKLKPDSNQKLNNENRKSFDAKIHPSIEDNCEKQNNIASGTLPLTLSDSNPNPNPNHEENSSPSPGHTPDMVPWCNDPPNSKASQPTTGMEVLLQFATSLEEEKNTKRNSVGKFHYPFSYGEAASTVSAGNNGGQVAVLSVTPSVSGPRLPDRSACVDRDLDGYGDGYLSDGESVPNDDEEDVLNEDTLIIGMGQVTDEMLAIAKKHNMHYYCQQPLDVYTLYAILGAVEISRKIDAQQEEDSKLEEQNDKVDNSVGSTNSKHSGYVSGFSIPSAPNSGRPLSSSWNASRPVSSSRPLSSTRQNLDVASPAAATTTTGNGSPSPGVTTATTPASTGGNYINAIRKNSFKMFFESGQD